jgi:hypothetical protein
MDISYAFNRKCVRCVACGVPPAETTSRADNSFCRTETTPDTVGETRRGQDHSPPTSGKMDNQVVHQEAKVEFGINNHNGLALDLTAIKQAPVEIALPPPSPRPLPIEYVCSPPLT